MLRRSSSPQLASAVSGGGIVLGLAKALGWKPRKANHPILSAEWIAERDAFHTDWRSAMAGLAAPQNELPGEPDADRPLSGITVAVGDDLDVCGFVTTAGCEQSIFHHSLNVEEGENSFVRWLKQRGAFVVGKLKCSVPFARIECSTLVNHSAAIAVKSRVCHVALSGSIIGPAALTAPLTSDVFAFKPSRSALPTFPAPFSSSHYSLGMVFRHVRAAESLWREMGGSGSRSGFMDDSDNLSRDYINRPMPKFLITPRKKATPVIRIGVPKSLIDSVLGVASASHSSSMATAGAEGKSEDKKSSVHQGVVVVGAGDALAAALQTKSTAEVYNHKKRVGLFRRLTTRLGNLLAGQSPSDSAASSSSSSSASSSSSSQQQGASSASSDAAATVVPIEIVNINLDWDIKSDDGVVKLASTIANYELARKLRENHMTEGGKLAQLPLETQAAINAGLATTLKEYEQAVAHVKMLRQDLADELASCDCVCAPLIAPPYAHHNLHTIGFGIAFTLPGNSFVSFRLPIGNAPEYDAVKKCSVLCDDVEDLVKSNVDRKPGFRLLKGEVTKSGATALPSLPILLTALPGQDSLIFEAARSLLQRVEK